MTNEEKQLLLKDLCARLPYGLKVQYKENIYDLLGLDKGRIFVSIARIGEWLPTVYTFDIKPYLRPISSMTEEEVFQLGRLTGAASYNMLKGDYSFLEELLKYVYKNHIDYFGLIPMGLALEAPEDMYNKMEE